MCVYVYIHTSLYIYIYMFIYICIYIYLHIYIYISYMCTAAADAAAVDPVSLRGGISARLKMSLRAAERRYFRRERCEIAEIPTLTLRNLNSQKRRLRESYQRTMGDFWTTCGVQVAARARVGPTRLWFDPEQWLAFILYCLDYIMICICLYVYIHIYIYTCMYVCVYIYTYIYIYIYIHEYMYTHVSATASRRVARRGPGTKAEYG